MPKFEVLATQHCFLSLEVEAEDWDSAIIIASQTPVEDWSNDDEELEIHNEVG
jgi:hypothetical protein